MSAMDSLNEARRDSIAVGAMKPETVKELENKTLDLLKKHGKNAMMQVSTGLMAGNISMSEGYIMINAIVKHSRELSDAEFLTFTTVPRALKDFINNRS